jgi:kinetochore protein Mis12/MTW1
VSTPHTAAELSLGSFHRPSIARTSMASKTSGTSASTEEHIELLTEHFGFNPKSFIDKLVYAANEHLYFLGDTLEKTILDRTGADEIGTTEAEVSGPKLQQRYRGADEEKTHSLREEKRSL